MLSRYKNNKFMKHIKEFKEIDFNDWDEEEENPNGENLSFEHDKITNCTHLKVNDYVNVIIDNKNLKGKIKAITNHRVGIEFDKHINGHNGLSIFNGKKGHCWIYNHTTKYQSNNHIMWLIDRLN